MKKEEIYETGYNLGHAIIDFIKEYEKDHKIPKGVQGVIRTLALTKAIRDSACWECGLAYSQPEL